MSSLNAISGPTANTITVVNVTGTDETAAAIVVVPLPPLVDSLRTVIHSRQASSSSCTSSVGNLVGSPKPEKRQANSPLPPTPKSSTASTTASGSGNHSNLTIGAAAATAASLPTSSRNSVGSVIEQQQIGVGGVGFSNSRHVSRENLPSAGGDNQSRSQSRMSIAAANDAKPLHDDDHGNTAKKRNSAKNLEGMYAKVSAVLSIKMYFLLLNDSHFLTVFFFPSFN